MGNADKQMSMDRSVVAEATATDIPYEFCPAERPSEPCALVILGASGDLAARKLLPSLYNLFLKEALPDPMLVVGCSRTEMNDETFIDRMKVAVAKKKEVDLSNWTRFSSCLHYAPLRFDDLASFVDLSTRLEALHKEFYTEGNTIFYLAIPPTLYKATAQMLGKSGLSAEGPPGSGWSRIVVEKPFGRDLDSAIQLDRSLHGYFGEHQIFRIDHYLAKETVQNILMFRFANAIFEPVWNRRYVDHVSITASETLGVEHRAGYYEEAGVLRDMFQNHMMQLLALTAMDPPSFFHADRVRDEKVRVYRSLRPFPLEDLGSYLVLGQYGAGNIEGREVPAYRDEPGVGPDSLTPTFAMMKIFLDNWRWQGVPFYLKSGKRLDRKLTQITIQFKEVPHSMFRQVLGEPVIANRLVMSIYPEERISLTFQTKTPGALVCLRSVTMDFQYHRDYDGLALDAYEKVLLDCMLGDQMLFWRQDGVELSWSFFTPILEECESCSNRPDMLFPYESGSRGPAAADELKRNHSEDMT